MKQIIAAYERPDGTIEPLHEVEVVCAHCKDEVSAEEESTGTCTNCNSPWQVSQSVSVQVTSLPSIQAVTIQIG